MSDAPGEGIRRYGAIPTSDPACVRAEPDPQGPFVFYEDHARVVGGMAVELKRLAKLSNDRWESIADMADALGLPTGKDSPQEVLDGITDLIAERDLLRGRGGEMEGRAP